MLSKENIDKDNCPNFRNSKDELIDINECTNISIYYEELLNATKHHFI